MKADTLKAVCELTLSPTELKLDGCPGLSVEDFSSRVFGKLLNEVVRSEAFEKLLEKNIDNGANAKLIRVSEEDIHKACYDFVSSGPWVEYCPGDEHPCGDELVFVRFRSGGFPPVPEMASTYTWNWEQTSSDIVAYRIAQ